MTGFDLAAGLILLVSGLAGFVRGATREMVTLAAFGAGAAAAVLLLPFSRPIARHFIHTSWLADLAAMAVAFLLIYVIVRLAGGRLIRGVRQTGLSGLDRALGTAFGLARGLVVLGFAALLIRASTPPERLPRWYTTARLYPVASWAGAVLQSLEPRGRALEKRLAPSVANAFAPQEPSSNDDADQPGE
jgi:membrane protein required for colicin V production